MVRSTRFARIDVTKALQPYAKMGANLNLASQDLQVELARAGAEHMKNTVETSGTGKTWQRPHYAKDSLESGRLRRGSSPGRVNTGNMRDSIGVRFERGAKRVQAAFGWIRNYEPYFGYQEGGFNHKQARITVPGMFALRDARRYVVQKVLPKAVKKYQKRIVRGVYS